MLYKNDWDKARQKFLEYWEKENHDRPLLHITAPRESYVHKPLQAPESLAERWTDTEYVIARTRNAFAGTVFAAEAYPNFWPNLGPDIFGAFLGCELEFGERTSWSDHPVTDWTTADKFVFDPQNKWWKKMKEMTEAIAADARGDYLVGITDLHAGADGLVALRSPENLCFDLLDNPEAVKKANFELLDIFKQVTDELHGIITRQQEGSTNWIGVWHPGKWYVTSSDFICMISHEMFDDFILPELLEELDWLDASLFHLDGPGALRHLDALLQIPKLKGIQWVYGAGQPTASHWIPVLKKIQAAGKLIHIAVVPEDLDVLLAELKPEGVMYTLPGCSSEQDARDLVRKVEKAYGKKLY